MKSRDNERLDAEELLHLAVEASGRGRHGDAIAYLKRAIEISKDDFKLVYLLAAQHAQIGMVDRAIAGFSEALEINPDFPPARFHLGLILMSVGRVSEALQALGALEQLNDKDPYLYFKRGLEALGRNDVAACERELTRGIQLNGANSALNADMQRLMESAKVLAKLSDVAAKTADRKLPDAYSKPSRGKR